MAEDIPEVAHVFIRGEGGSVFKMDLPLQENVEERLLKGYVTRVQNADGDPYTGDDVTTVTERPAINASKATWVGWAVTNGMTPDDAEALTKTDLIEKFGTEPLATPEVVEPAPAAPVDGAEAPATEPIATTAE